MHIINTRPKRMYQYKSYEYNIDNNEKEDKWPKKYIESKSIREAEDFAKQLGIKRLNVDSLYIANYVNRGLMEYKNITGRKPPKIDLVTDKNWERYAGVENASMSTGHDDEIRFLYINPKYHAKMTNGNINIRLLKEYLDNSDYSFTEQQRKLIQKAELMGKHITTDEGLALDSLEKYLDKSSRNNNVRYLGIINDPNTKKIQRKNGIKHIEYCDFIKLSKEEKNYIINTLLDLGCKISSNTVSKYHSLFHEIAHIKHEKRIGLKKLEKMYQGLDNLGKTNNAYKLDSTRTFKSREKNHGACEYLSCYALTCPVEFVAEMYSGMLEGNTYCKELKKMYKKSHGPKITFLTKLRNYIENKFRRN